LLGAPMLGALRLPHDQMPLTKWPLFPVAKSGETYCVLSEGYSLAGFPEPIPDYLTYCKTHGAFRTNPVRVPDRETAIQDLSAIRLSKRWTDIKWKNSGQGFSYTMSEPWIWDAIIAQAESMKQ
jgi:hypothetical protein